MLKKVLILTEIRKTKKNGGILMPQVSNEYSDSRFKTQPYHYINVNGLYTPVKKERLSVWVKNERPNYMLTTIYAL